MLKKTDILYEDNDIIVCVKQAGVPSESDKKGAMDLTSMVLNYLARSDRSKPPYAALVHRLDRPVGGAMVFAKNKQAAASLSRQFKEHLCTKNYYAVVTDCTGTEGRLTDYILEDRKNNVSSFAADNDKDARKAELLYKVLGTKEIEGRSCSLVDVELLTGRHHQIRLQMTRIGSGIWGDTKYNGQFKDTGSWTNVALFSYKLTINHPSTGKSMTFTAKPTLEVFGEFVNL